MSNKIPFGPDTDYPEVLRITKEMYGDIMARGTKCCHPPQVSEALDKALRWMYAADLADASGDEVRYEQAVKAAYLTLYPFSMDQNYNYEPHPEA